MEIKNTFIPKPLLPLGFNLKVEEFLIREPNGVDSIETFLMFMKDLKKWASKSEHYIESFESISKIQRVEEIPLFIIEMVIRNSDDKKLVVRSFTNLDLLECLSKFDDLFSWQVITEKMES